MKNEPALVVSVQVGLPREVGREGARDPMDRRWRTGFFKKPTDGPLWLGRTNLEGDGQADLEHHGGPDKAVCVYPTRHYPFWRRDLGLPDLSYGAFGENFTVSGVAEGDICIGDVYQVGSARVEISQPRQPCWKLARRWRIKDLAVRVQSTGYTGWYFRVLEEGWVEAGQALVLVERPNPEWSIARANEIMHEVRHDRESARALAACPSLSESWRETLTLRARTGENPDLRPRIVGANEEPSGGR